MSNSQGAQICTDKLSWKTKLGMAIFGFGIRSSVNRSNGTINRFIMSLFDIKSPPTNTPKNGIQSTDVVVDPNRNLWFRLYNPTATDTSLPVIIYFHGGGFAFVSANSIAMDTYCKRLAKQLPAVIISVNYRLTPEHRYPCQYDDGLDVLKFIDSNLNFKGFPANADLNRCFVAGDSAGGNIAHHVTLRACDSNFSSVNIIGLIGLQPFFGGEERTESEIKLVDVPYITIQGTDSLWRMFLPEGSNRDHPAANVSGPNADDISKVAKFPSTIVFVGGFDPLKDWQKRYYEALKRHGKEAYLVEYPNVFHAFYSIPELEESDMLIEEVKRFMEKQSLKVLEGTTK
ncbi:putative Carboxyesterase 18 [Tripterygium wilfordii]|uniref:Putative Carboxyesterase 18 n=2 Tax=Tripterygium wilfordii TaxID=458696 RepID=A0A7J7CXM8_TRIWF|nr:putative Carboxyesterase 18 [Tripterygium wilfordii]